MDPCQDDTDRRSFAPRFESRFSKLWLAKAVSAVGSRITREGLPYAAVLTLSATPVQMGILAGAGGVPVMLFGLLAGVWVDRVRRRPVLVACDLARAVALLVASFGTLFAAMPLVVSPLRRLRALDGPAT